MIGLRSVAWLFGFYLMASQVAQTLLYTLVTYVVAAANKTGADFSNTINEIAGQYLLLSFSLGALLLMVTTWLGDKALYRHDAFWTEPHKTLWQLNRLNKQELLRGLSSGAMAAAVYLLVITASGQAAFLGIYITSTLGTPVFPLFFLNLLALGTLLVCEEYIFRHKILKQLLQKMSPLQAVVCTSALYILVKELQFTLQPLDYLNLLFLNVALGFFFLKSGCSHRNLGFLLALFGFLHPLAGLPLWEVESPSFFLFKTNARSSELLTGNSAGPMAGLALTSILLVFSVGAYLSWKKSLEAKRQMERIARLN